MKIPIFILTIGIAAAGCSKSANKITGPQIEMDRSSEVVSEHDLNASGCKFMETNKDLLALTCDSERSPADIYQQTVGMIEYMEAVGKAVESSKERSLTNISLIGKSLATFDTFFKLPMFDLSFHIDKNQGADIILILFYAHLQEIARYDRILVKFRPTKNGSSPETSREPIIRKQRQDDFEISRRNIKALERQYAEYKQIYGNLDKDSAYLIETTISKIKAAIGDM